MFETLERKPPDAILKLIGEYAADPRGNKIDLGVGIYRDAAGETPVFSAVKKAEQRLVETQASKAYLGSRGAADYCEAIQLLAFGDAAAGDGRVMTLQTPGGSGALRVAAGVISRANPDAALWVSEPTWNNHWPLLGGAGLDLRPYPYYDTAANALLFAEMLDAIGQAAAGDVVLLHGCCHNPTGLDLSQAQWNQVIDLILERKLVPFVDLAYQGFAEGLDEDAFAVRAMYERVPEMIVAASCSKNFGLYRDRTGSLTLVSADEDTAGRVSSQALNIVRTMYSVPPDHGGAAVTLILADPALREEWLAELGGMRGRMQEMRRLAVAALAETAPGHDFAHVELANGMFCYLGVTPEQVARLKKEFGIYLVDSGRINVCGITPGNVAYLAESVAAVIA